MLGPILFARFPITLFHINFSDDNQLYTFGNLSQLPKIIHSTQSCTSDVNNQLQSNNDKTEMIPTARETILNCDCSTVHKPGGF